MPIHRKEWASFGMRLKWSRKKAKLTQVELAAILTDKHLGYSVSRKHIAFWERIGTDEERTGDSTRFMHPSEYPAISEILNINGLWLFLYEREPSLKPAAPDPHVSAIFGRPPPRSPEELELYGLLRALSTSQISSLISIIRTFSEHSPSLKD